MPPTLFSLFHYHTQNTPDFGIGTRTVTLDEIKAYYKNQVGLLLTQTSRSLVHGQLHGQFGALLEKIRKESPKNYETAFAAVQELGVVVEQLFEKNKDL